MYQHLKNHFGYTSFRPLQEEIITTVLAGRDALVLMPTGGGKSLCFQLPALLLPGITLVISPLIALMKDQVDTLCANGISAAMLNSSLSRAEQEEIMRDAQLGDIKLLYLAPERIHTDGFSTFLSSLNVSLLAIDEAHCISEWGHDFRPEYRQLTQLRTTLFPAPVIALTATATPQVKEDIVSQLNMTKDSTFVSSFNRTNLHYSVRPKLRVNEQLISLLATHKGEAAIVYCFSRKQTEDVADMLRQAGLHAAPYHAGLQRDVRAATQERFIRDQVPIIVATIAFGMGIDKPDVRLVVHMDLPKTIEGYYQETGRAGRDGLPSTCVLFYTYADKRKQDFFIQQIESEQEKAAAAKKLDAMLSYCQSTTCRRVDLLRYFGEPYNQETCDACDNCVRPPTEEFDGTEIAQKILSAVLRTGERFGAAHICDVLRGSHKQKIQSLGHNTLSVHGIAKDVPTPTLRFYIDALKQRGYLEQHPGEYPTLYVGHRGKQALNAREHISLPVPNEAAAPKRASASSLAYHIPVFERLRTLRKQIADTQDVPPFVIFGDKSLYEMAYYLPSTLEAFGQLFGVGERKREAFGAQFVAEILLATEKHNLEERPIPQKLSKTSNTSRKLSGTLQETRQLLEEGHSIDAIATQRGLTAGTVVAHIIKIAQADDAPPIEHLKPNTETLQEIASAFTDTGAISLTAVHKALNKAYSYEDLRIARLFLD